jgi:hypothetical protein
LELRQEASDLLEYSNAKLGRVTRYLGFLADRTRKLDEAALETETRITPLINEKKRLFNDLLTLKGTVLSSVLPDLQTTHLCGLSLSWH